MGGGVESLTHWLATVITSAQDVTSVLSALRPGDVIAVKIVRGSTRLTKSVTLGTNPKG